MQASTGTEDDFRGAVWRLLRPPRDADRLVRGLAAGAGLVVASGVAVVLLDEYLGVRSPSMTFMCSVILAAAWFGQRVALGTAFLAFGVYNFYLTEPAYTFGVAGPEDVLTLLVFVGAAILIGHTAGRLHDQQVRTRQDAQTFETLFALSRTMAERRTLEDSFFELAEGACRLGAAEALVFVGDAEKCAEVARAPATAQAPPSLRQAAAQLLAHAPFEASEHDGWKLSRSIEGGAGPVAVLAWKQSKAGDGRDIAVGLLVDLGRTSIARLLALQQRVEMESFAAAERLRSALMASISHDFRTPLAAIMASASSLRSQGDKFSSETQADLLTGIQEEAERLSRYVANILDMTRLDTNVLQINAEFTDPTEAIELAANRVSKRLGGRALKLQIPAAAPSVKVDGILLEQAITNVLENAITHTAPAATIRLGCDYSGDKVTVWAEDDGPGVPAADMTRIFDKFYRIDNPSNAAHGAGLGLAISKGFVEAMGGEVSASRSLHSRSGLRVSFQFPRAAMEASQ